jgi:hypothetical protein
MVWTKGPTVRTTLADERVWEPLAAFATIPEWLGAAMDPDRVGGSLRAHVPELASGRTVLEGCAVDRLRAKRGAWLGRYTVHVSHSEGMRAAVVLVGRLTAPGQPSPDGVAPPSSVPFGDPGWRVLLPDLRLELEVQATDEALPSLPGLVDPQAAAMLLQPLLRDAGYPDVTISRCEPVVARYKPGSRCTIVAEMTYDEPRTGSAAPNPLIVKTYEGDKGQVAWDAMTALWQRPERWSHAVRLAEPVAYLPGQRVLVQGPVPGSRTLKELAHDAIATGQPQLLDRLRFELARSAWGLAALHQSGASYGRTAVLEDELDEVTEVVEGLALSVPELEEAAARLLAALAAGSAEVPADPVGPAHHDFRPAQVLLHDAGPGFIDFDGAGMAEPALDLGGFRAKLRSLGIATLGRLDGPADPRVAASHSLLDELCEHFLGAYRERAEVSLERVQLWETCDLLTSLLHAWTKVRVDRLDHRVLTLTHQLRSSTVAREA